MYKEDLALNNLQWLICHKTKPLPSQLQRDKTPLTSVLDMTLNILMVGALGNAEYPFIAIALRSSLARSGSP